MSLTALKQDKRFSRDNLHSYQNKAVKRIVDNEFTALWLDMGLGKTVSVLTALSDLFNDWEIDRVLVIAPKRVAMDTWHKEIDKWQHTSHLTWGVAAGLTKARREAFFAANLPEITIINRELVEWLVNFWGKDWPFDMVVLDESSSFKSSKAKRFKALKKVLPFIDRLVELTGTPSSNSLLDIWPQIYLLDKGERLCKTITAYKRKYFDSDYMGYSWTPKKGAEEKIHAKLEDLCLTMSAEDYLELPERIDNVIELELPQKVRKQYDELEREFLLELDNDETVEVLFAAALVNKLLQMSNGAMYINDSKDIEVFHDAKLEALDSIIEEAEGKPILIAYNFKHDLVRLKARYPHLQTLNDDNAIDRWNNREIQLLAAHPQSAGHGLNLQNGGNIMVWFGLNWSLELYQQFNARLHRQGQTQTVINHHLVIKDSADETVMEALASKNVTQKALLNALKEDIGARV